MNQPLLVTEIYAVFMEKFIGLFVKYYTPVSLLSDQGLWSKSDPPQSMANFCEHVNFYFWNSAFGT